MEEKRVTKEQFKAALSEELDKLAESMAEAMNNAQWGPVLSQ